MDYFLRHYMGWRDATVYVDKDVEVEGAIVKSLRQLKFDLDDHFEKGGKLLGHNIVAFDLPALRDSMDIYCIRKYLEIKTSVVLIQAE